MLWLSPQSLLFLTDYALRGIRLSVYVLIKILKFCTGSSVKSYQCKFAIGHSLRNRVVSDLEELGDLIQEMIYFWTLRGKFCSVHPELSREGIIRVDVGKEGLQFIRDTGADWNVFWDSPTQNNRIKVTQRGKPLDFLLVTRKSAKRICRGKPLFSQRKMKKRSKRKNFWGGQLPCRLKIDHLLCREWMSY